MVGRPNMRMHRARSRASLGRSPVMRSPLGPLEELDGG